MGTGMGTGDHCNYNDTGREFCHLFIRRTNRPPGFSVKQGDAGTDVRALFLSNQREQTR